MSFLGSEFVKFKEIRLLSLEFMTDRLQTVDVSKMVLIFSFYLCSLECIQL